MSILRDAAEMIEAINDDAEAFEVRYTLHDVGECDDDGEMDCVDFMLATERKFWAGGDISDV